MANDQVLDRIEAKVSALLAIQVDRYIRETGIARPKVRSIDKMLRGVGMLPKDIAALLGKTERAVYLALDEGDKASSKKNAKATGDAIDSADDGTAS